MRPPAWFPVAVVVVGCSSAYKPDLVQSAACRDCEPIVGEPLRPVATYAWVPVSTAWYSVCHHDAANGQDGLISDCDLVDYTPSFACPDDRCRFGPTTAVRPAPGELNGNTRDTGVMITTPGPVDVTATLTPTRCGRPWTATVPMIAATPDRVAVGCVAESDVVYVQLYAGDAELRGVPRDLVVALVVGGRCRSQLSPVAGGVAYHCPFTRAANSITVTNPDFATTVPLPCPALAARFAP